MVEIGHGAGLYPNASVVVAAALQRSLSSLHRASSESCANLNGAQARQSSFRTDGAGCFGAKPAARPSTHVDTCDEEEDSVRLPPIAHPLAASASSRMSGPQALRLPVPSRHCNSVKEIDADSQLPSLVPAACMPAPCGLSQKRQAPASRRNVPQRLQALDDQTVVPRDVYNKMLACGDEARGRLGYGQHRLVFDGPDGAPLLRRFDVSRSAA